MGTPPEVVTEDPPRPRRRLTRRSGESAVIGGVAGGLADYLGLDAVWVRLGFAATVLLGGAGVLAYIVLWMVLPEGPEAPADESALARVWSRVGRALRRLPRSAGTMLIAAGGLLVVAQIFHWRAGVLWGLGLILAGVVLFREHDRPPGPSLPATPLGSLEGGAASELAIDASAAEPLQPAPAAGPPSPARPTAQPPPRPPRFRRERSALGWLALGALLVVLGTVAALDLGGAADVALVQYLALAEAVIGLGLVAAGFVGRARWLVLPGLVLIPAIVFASLVKVPIEGGFGQRYERVVRAGGVYRLVGGSIHLDLREIDPSGGAIEATVVAGGVEVVLPPDVRAEVRGRAGVGQVRLLDQVYGGVEVDERRVIGPPARRARAVVSLDLHVAFGGVEVRHPYEEEL